MNKNQERDTSMPTPTNKPTPAQAQTKKLYVVSVSFEFAVLAESENEARRVVDQAADDCIDYRNAQVRRGVNPDTGWVHIPEGYDGDTLVYGTSRDEGDVTFDEAVEREKEALAQAKRTAEFLEKQGDLFGTATASATKKDEP